MFENFFTQRNAYVMRYILEHEQTEQVIASECDVWDELQAVPSYCERFMVQEQEEMDEFTKTAHFCGECGRTYQWSADDIAWEFEKPFMPCGHSWKFLDKQLDDEVVAVILIQGPVTHDDDTPWCEDEACECHYDEAGKEERERLLWQPYYSGLLTWDEVLSRFYGKVYRGMALEV